MRSHHLNDRPPLGALFNRRATRSRAVLNAQSMPGSLFKRRAKRPSAVAQSGEIGLSLTSGAGSLFKRRAKRPNAVARSGEIGLQLASGAEPRRGEHWLAFAGIYLFTLMLYARPNDLFPALGDFPLVKIVAISVLLIYIGSKNVAGARPTVWTLEMTMLMVIAALGLLFMPVAASPKDSLDLLADKYLKTVVIFILMVNLIDTRQRIFSLWKLVVVCGATLGVGAINSYVKGEFTARGLRIEGLVGGMFENPNDLATALNLLLPFAVLLTLTREGIARLFYLACSAVIAIGVLVTFSRGGFLGLIASTGLMLWKMGRGRRLKTTLGTALILGVLFSVLPGGYGARMVTIFNTEEDQTGSAQLRRELMERAASIAINRPIIGVGMGNFHIYSIREKAAHNSYLEIAAELGMMGLIAYLILIFAPLRSLHLIERQTRGMGSNSEREMYWLSVSIQAAFVAYLVCSFFASIQYLWYLYYTAAYAVALRQIHAAEEMESRSSDNRALAAWPVAGPRPAGGALWPAYRLR
ncbi:MAG TPA: O-antigen ligase family protein [Blastocatellia bacterium]|nr:O-antigen ligase family protein [Blastocatellia bacterium]